MLLKAVLAFAVLISGPAIALLALAAKCASAIGCNPHTDVALLVVACVVVWAGFAALAVNAYPTLVAGLNRSSSRTRDAARPD